MREAREPWQTGSVPRARAPVERAQASIHTSFGINAGARPG